MDYDQEIRKLRLLKQIKIGSEDECWEWQGKRYERGYGCFCWGMVNGKYMSFNASRAAYKLLKGHVPDNENVLHTCNNRPCCNPNHLYLGSHQDNANDRERAGHTARGETHPAFKRYPALIAELSRLLEAGVGVKSACRVVEIGPRTFFRAQNHDPKFAALVQKTKPLRVTRKKKGNG